MKPIPFDLEKFKAGQLAITRDGRTAKFVAYEPEAADLPLVAFVAGKRVTFDYTKNGHFYVDEQYSINDLVAMAPKPLKGFLAILGCSNVGQLFREKEEAKKFAADCGLPIVAVIDLSQFTEGHGLEP